MQNNAIPDIMKPGRLRALNEYAIEKVGTPIFFYAPDVIRPITTCPGGQFYEIVTGLYIIYKDYGIGMLREFLSFCVSHTHTNFNPFGHYNAVNDLRGGLCHGSFPGGAHERKLRNTVSYYFYGQEVSPSFQTLDNSELSVITGKLVRHSNGFVQQLYSCIDQLSQDEQQLQAWRRTLTERVFTPHDSKQGRELFDGRILKDIEASIRRGAQCKAHRTTVEDWLQDVRARLLDGTIENSEALYNSLKEALEELYWPVTAANQSSASILFGDFSLD